MAGGAAINVVIKSGTNSFRGTALGLQHRLRLARAELLSLGHGAEARRPPESVRRQLRRTDREEQAVLLRELRADEARTDRAGAAVQRRHGRAAPRATSAAPASPSTIPRRNPDPALRTPFPGNIIPSEPHRPGRDRDDATACRLPRHRASSTTTRRKALKISSATTTTSRSTSTRTAGCRSSDATATHRRTSSIRRRSGEAGGDALAGGQLGTRAGHDARRRLRRHLYVRTGAAARRATSATRTRSSAPRDPTSARTSASTCCASPAPTGPTACKAACPRSRSTAGRTWATRTPAIPFQFDDKQYVATVNLSVVQGHARDAHRASTTQNQQLNHFQPQGGTFQTARGTFQFNGNSTRLQNAAAAGRLAIQQLGGLPARPAERRGQGRAAAQPELGPHAGVRRLRAGSVAAPRAT